MKVIKALVIGMGVLIALGIGLLVWGIARGTSKAVVEQPRPATASLAGESKAAYDVRLALPAGMALKQMTTVGDRIVLRLSGDEAERIVVIDPRDGHTSGTIDITPATP